MDRQLTLNLETEEERRAALREYVAPLGFSDREVAVLEVMAARGERAPWGKQHASIYSDNRVDAGKYAGCSPNTFAAGATDLARHGLLDVLKTTRPWTYVINWDRVAKLQPSAAKSPLEASAIFASDWSPPDQARSTADHPLLASLSKDSLESLSLESLSSLLPMGDVLSHRRPWDVVEDKHLVASIDRGDTRLPWRLYEEGLKAPKKGDPTKTWWKDGEDNRLRFLTIFHHSAKASGIHSRIAMLKSRCGRGLDSSGIAHEHVQWAAGVLSRANAAPATGEAARACEAMADACRPDRETREHGDRHAEQ